MPIYEYACTACGERTEAKQSFDDPPLDTCEICGGKLRKLYSPVGVVFKGSGFYSTDAKKATKSSGASSSGGKDASPADSKNEKPKSESSASGGSDKKDPPSKTTSTSTGKEAAS